MKKIFLTVAIVVAAMTSCASSHVAESECEMENGVFAGTFFQSEMVTSEFEDANGCAITYTDPDANMEEVVIYLDVKSYAKVINAIVENKHFCGHLDSMKCINGIPTFKITK